MAKDKTPLYVKGQEVLQDPEAFSGLKQDEFPHRSSLLDINRRDLLKFMGGSLAMAGLASGCRFLPQQKIVPFVQAPEDRLPGEESRYATAASLGGYGTGLIVRSYEGRPIKIDGNPGHPSSNGSTDARTQAELAVMYDPDRLKNPQVVGDYGTWDEFFKNARAAMSKSHDGAGVAILTQNVGSPSLAGQISAFLKANPAAKWFQYEPVNRDNLNEGSMLAFGQYVDTVYRFDLAEVVLSLDCDFILDGPGNVRYQGDLASRRSVDDSAPNLSRIYAVEGVPTLVGAMADHRWPVRSSKILDVAKALAAKLGITGAAGSLPHGIDDKALTSVANDLMSSKGKGIVIAGAHQPAAVHALVHAINAALDNSGATVLHLEPVLAKPTSNVSDIQALTTAMRSGQVSLLLMVGGNPVLDAPADLRFADALAQVPFSAHLSLAQNETTQKCLWQLPESHFLESWGDARGHDGTACVVQPLIEPMYDSKSAIEMFESLLNKGRTGLEIVKDTWKKNLTSSQTFDDAWQVILSTGVIPATAAKVLQLSPTPNMAAGLSAQESGDMELLVLHDPTVYDGRFSNIGWLQELPKPLTNITWDNTFQMSPATAKKLGVGQQDRMLGIPYYGNWDVIRVTANGATVEGPVYIHFGMADDLIVVHTGYGRQQAGMVGNVGDMIHQGGGFDAYPLRTVASPWLINGVQVAKTGRNYKIANTQFHNLLDHDETDSGRDVIRETTLATFLKNRDVLEHPTEPTMEVKGEEREKTSIWKGPDGFNSPDEYQWAMTIDLNLCTGCNACVLACQSENNIPTVGKEQVLRHREMHWIRIDRYYRAESSDRAFDENNPVITFQPVTCMQCEKAPCEPVCPVAATTHSHEGLNQMVYNRCVGTRYCSNNCPYKVRRFNFLLYTKRVEDVPVLKLLQNPDVTVRGRGVMEKCTYCVQRINRARIEAKKAGREIKDGEVVTACQQVCPSKAIIFGDMRRPANAVSKSRASKRNYVLLENVNTRPRTTYLGKVRNPNPELEA